MKKLHLAVFILITAIVTALATTKDAHALDRTFAGSAQIEDRWQEALDHDTHGGFRLFVDLAGVFPETTFSAEPSATHALVVNGATSYFWSQADALTTGALPFSSLADEFGAAPAEVFPSGSNWADQFVTARNWSASLDGEVLALYGEASDGFAVLVEDVGPHGSAPRERLLLDPHPTAEFAPHLVYLAE